MATCPYPGCSAAPEPSAPTCSQGRHLLVWCACGTPNRLLARYCRSCKQRLRARGEWRLPKGDAQGSASIPTLVPFSPDLQLAEVHRFTLGGRLQAQFVAAHGHLFFAVARRGVVIYRCHDGELIAAATRNLQPSALAVTDEFLLVGGDAGLEALPLKELLLQGDAPSRLLLPAALAAGRGQSLVVVESPHLACVVTPDALQAISLESGLPTWHRPRPGRGLALVAQVGGQIVVAEESGEVWAVAPATGELRWQQKLPDGVRVRAGLAAWESRLHLITRSGQLVLINGERGTVLQTGHSFAEVNGLACHERHLFVTGLAGLHRCLPTDPYYQTLLQQPVYAPPLVTAGTLFTGSANGTLVYTDVSAQTDRYQASGGVQDIPQTTPVLLGGRLYLGSETGEVAVFALGREEVLAP